jgi:hypothetical protein
MQYILFTSLPIKLIENGVSLKLNFELAKTEVTGPDVNFLINHHRKYGAKNVMNYWPGIKNVKNVLPVRL